MRARVAMLVLLAATSARAQGHLVLLELRPRTGDTVRMRLDQTTELTGGRRGASTKQVVTTLTMYSRAIVEASLPASALITAITDSVDLVSNDEHARALARQAQAQLEGRQMRLRLAPDGTVGVADQESTVPREVSDLVSVMPASFPREMVETGTTWERAMPIPPNPSFGIGVGWIVRALFRFDSTSDGGNLAFISMRGGVENASGSTANTARMNGTVTGSMVVNRRRGWLSESRFLVQMLSTVMSPDAGGRLVPMQLRLRISQHMRVDDKR